MIALAAQYVDDNPETKPLNVWDIGGHNERLLSYHFVLSDPTTGKVRAESDNSSIANPSSPQLHCLFSAADRARGLGKMDASRIFLGEALHAFEDTFGHRDRDNKPFNADGGIGHAFYGSQPDYTFDDRMDSTDGSKLPLGWYVREGRTLEMEQEVFNLFLTEHGDAGKAKTWAEIKPIVEGFNKFRAHEDTKQEEVDSGYEDGKFADKIEILNKALEDLHYEGIDMSIANEGAYRYKDTDGKAQRDANLSDLDPKDYRCTILPGGKFESAKECPKP